MKITFSNSTGKVCFGDGEVFKITALSGIYIPSKIYGTINYAGYDGQLTYQTNATARTITLGVDIVSKNVRRYLENAMKVLNSEGTLVFDYGDKVRKIYCNQVTFSMSERSVSHAVFALQFVCDDPYFTDLAPMRFSLHGSVGNITNPITLPCVLSTSDTKKIITNSGHANVFPVITIYVQKKGTNNSEYNYGYKFKNNTTGKEIYLKYVSNAGETITIDIEKRTAKGNITGNLISYVDMDTWLEDFYLVPGDNDIEAIDLGAGDISRISIKYQNKYVEAVY